MAGGTALSVALPFAPALAQEGALSISFSTVEVIQILAVFTGVVGAALISVIVLIRERGRTSAENVVLRARIADLNASIQRGDALLNLRDQRLIVWASDRRNVELLGALPADTAAPADRAGFLAFGRWLMPRSAASLDNAVLALREKAVPFDLTIETNTGVPLEVQGRKTAVAMS